MRSTLRKVQHSFPSIRRSRFISRLQGPQKRPESATSHLEADLRKLELSVLPYEYTDGRWLHADQIQQQARQVRFDFPALCRRVIQLSPSAQRIEHCEKKEGGFNRAFVFRLDNGKRLVARVPFSIAGPANYTIQSEVATMQYLQKQTTIPIPKIKDWSTLPNSIGCEYIIMEHATGVQLHQVWPDMSTHQRMLCIKHLTKIIQQMTQLRFPAYGGIYHADADLALSRKISVNEEFCISAHPGTPFWNCDPLEPRSYNRRPSNRGPWPNLEEYNGALVDAGIAQLPSDASISDQQRVLHGSVEEHLKLLEICRDVVTQRLPHVAAVSETSIPTLYHHDLHARNIFVDEEKPSEITAIIDWQTTAIEPVFSYVNEIPDLIDPPSTSEQEKDGVSTYPVRSIDATSKSQKDAEICQKTFTTGIQAWSPGFFAARAQNEDYFRLLRFVSNAWSLGSAAIRQELMVLAEQWDKLGLPAECPYKPSQEEILKHKTEFEEFEVRQRLKNWLQSSLHSNGEGWRPTEAFEAAEEAHLAAFEQWLRTNEEELAAGDQDATEERARRLWPWDGNGRLSGSQPT